MIDEAETTLSSIDNASDRLVQSVLKQAHSSGAANYASGEAWQVHAFKNAVVSGCSQLPANFVSEKDEMKDANTFACCRSILAILYQCIINAIH